MFYRPAGLCALREPPPNTPPHMESNFPTREQMRMCGLLKDRKTLFKKEYKQSFVARDAVLWMRTKASGYLQTKY